MTTAARRRHSEAHTCQANMDADTKEATTTTTNDSDNAAVTNEDVTFDVLLYLARCSDVALVTVVLVARLVLLCVMLASHRLLPHLFRLPTLTFDTCELLYGDARLSEVRHWDSVHFFHIAQHGYTHDNLYVFFPLVPMLIRGVTWLTTRAVPLLHSMAPVSFYMCLLHMGATCAAAVVLRRLTALTFVPVCCQADKQHKDKATDNDDDDDDDECGRRCVHACTVLDRLPTLDAWIAREATCVVRREYSKSSSNNNNSKGSCRHGGGGGGVSVCVAQGVLRERVVGGAMLMWVLSPAAVFTVAVYTEGFFSLLVFLGIYCMACRPRHRIGADEPLWCVHEVCATLCFVAASTARSNGFVCIGFLLYPTLLRMCFVGEYVHRLRHNRAAVARTTSATKSRSPAVAPNAAATVVPLVHRRWPRVARVCVLLCECVLVLLPYMAVNYHGWHRFAALYTAHERARVGVCFWRLYTLLQARYWGVGFLTAYTVPNLPNLIIALPTACTVTATMTCFVLWPAVGLWRRRCRHGHSSSNSSSSSSSSRHSNNARKAAGGGQSVRTALCHYTHEVYTLAELIVQSCNVAYLFVLALLAFTLMHVQVCSRFLMSCPALYWLCGCQLALRPLHLCTRALLVCSVAWALLGAVLFANHMPWT